MQRSSAQAAALMMDEFKILRGCLERLGYHVDPQNKMAEGELAHARSALDDLISKCAFLEFQARNGQALALATNYASVRDMKQLALMPVRCDILFHTTPCTHTRRCRGRGE